MDGNGAAHYKMLYSHNFIENNNYVCLHKTRFSVSLMSNITGI